MRKGEAAPTAPTAGEAQTARLSEPSWVSCGLRSQALAFGEGDVPPMSAPGKYSAELRERAVRLVFESPGTTTQ
jgi:hypothetical protein